MKWLCKKNFDVLIDEDDNKSRGEHLGYEILLRTDSGIPRGTHLGHDFILLDGADTKHPEINIDSDGIVTVIESVIVKSINDEYDTMNKDVYTEVYQKFETQNPDSVTADALTSSLMVEDPTFFVGIVAERDAGAEIKKGDTLNTNEKVLLYAAELKRLQKEYAVYRINRKNKFRKNRDELLNGWYSEK